MLVGGSWFACCRVVFLLLAVLIALLPAAGWWGLARWGGVDWPSGTSGAGFVCGLIAGGIVLFEMLLWVRKKLRGYRRLLFLIPLGPARWWMFLHVWLGLLAIPLAVIHSGFHFGGPLSAWVLALFLLVSASGVWGLAMQQLLPQRILDEVPGESIASQVDRVMESHARDAEQLVLGLTEPAPVGADEMMAPATATVVRVRPLADFQAASQLRTFFSQEVVPYLKAGRASGSVLRSADQARRLFTQLDDVLPEHAREHVRGLEKLCDYRRQLDRQTRLDWWLHSWLYVHFPLSVALTVLLFWHAAVALKFW